MPLQVYTARVDYVGPDRLDITRAGADRARKAGQLSPGEPFAPSWKILGPALEARKHVKAWAEAGNLVVALTEESALWERYAPAYVEEMRRSYKRYRAAWNALLARAEVTLCCTCVHPSHCHRFLLAEILGKLGAELRGERPQKEAA